MVLKGGDELWLLRQSKEEVVSYQFQYWVRFGEQLCLRKQGRKIVLKVEGNLIGIFFKSGRVIDFFEESDVYLFVFNVLRFLVYFKLEIGRLVCLCQSRFQGEVIVCLVFVLMVCAGRGFFETVYYFSGKRVGFSEGEDTVGIVQRIFQEIRSLLFRF